MGEKDRVNLWIIKFQVKNQNTYGKKSPLIMKCPLSWFIKNEISVREWVREILAAPSICQINGAIE